MRWVRLKCYCDEDRTFFNEIFGHQKYDSDQLDKTVLKGRKIRLKQQLPEPTNLVQRHASRDLILSSWRNRKARKAVEMLKFFLYIFRIWFQFQNMTSVLTQLVV